MTESIDTCLCGCGRKPRPDRHFIDGHYDGRPPRMLKGEESTSWKGDKVGYSAIHLWLKKVKPKTGKCERCGNKPEGRTEYANISGTRTRNVSHYRELCVSCHRRLDLNPPLMLEYRRDCGFD